MTIIERIQQAKDKKRKHLYLSNNSLTELPEELFELEQLTLLDLSNNPLKQIPQEIGKLINLDKLVLDRTQIKTLPAEIGNLTKLSRLDLDHNSIEELPNEFGQLSELEHLSIKGNRMENLPPILGKLTKLHCLHLENNRLNTLPEELSNLKSLKMIELNQNKFKEVPQSLLEIDSLTYLDIENNQIEHLPETISNLQNLNNLNLRNNCLQELPVTITELQKLNYLQKENNQFSNMPHIADMGIIEVAGYLNALKGINSFTTIWEIPQTFQTSFQQYLEFFGEFAKSLTGHDVRLNVDKIDIGIKLRLSIPQEMSIDEVNQLLEDFMNKDIDFYQGSSLVTKEQKFQIQQLMRDWRFERQNLYFRISNQKEKIDFLREKIEDKDKQIEKLQIKVQFFQSCSTHIVDIDYQDISPEATAGLPIILPGPSLSKPEFNADMFKKELIDKLARMTERKMTHTLEDLHNDFVTDYLRDKGYIVTDQTRSGSGSGLKNAGELDIMIRSDSGCPMSIIEAFILESCGPNNTIIDSHIYKLLHNYDTAGNKVNFVIVYATAANFHRLWENYKIYMTSINDKNGCCGNYALIDFYELELDKINIRLGCADHYKEGRLSKVYHIFTNMGKSK